MTDFRSIVVRVPKYRHMSSYTAFSNMAYFDTFGRMANGKCIGLTSEIDEIRTTIPGWATFVPSGMSIESSEFNEYHTFLSSFAHGYLSAVDFKLHSWNVRSERIVASSLTMNMVDRGAHFKLSFLSISPEVKTISVYSDDHSTYLPFIDEDYTPVWKRLIKLYRERIIGLCKKSYAKLPDILSNKLYN